MLSKSQKYAKEFLKLDKTNKDLEATLDKILVKERKIETSCVDWNIEQFETFLKSLHSISPNTISRAVEYLNAFAKFISDKEKIAFKEYTLEMQRRYHLVDYDKLLSVTLSPEEYNHIINQFDKNVRDKLILELAWECLLSPDEIKTIETDNIEFVDDFTIIKMTDGRIFRVENPEITEDIKKCLEDTYYHIHTKDGKHKQNTFRASKYLIKPTNVGRMNESGEDWIANPSLVLQKALKQQQVTCEGISVEELNVAHIKRSKIIWLLSQGVDKMEIANTLEADNIDSSLFWLERVVEKKYGKESL